MSQNNPCLMIGQSIDKAVAEILPPPAPDLCRRRAAKHCLPDNVPNAHKLLALGFKMQGRPVIFFPRSSQLFIQLHDQP